MSIWQIGWLICAIMQIAALVTFAQYTNQVEVSTGWRLVDPECPRTSDLVYYKRVYSPPGIFIRRCLSILIFFIFLAGMTVCVHHIK